MSRAQQLALVPPATRRGEALLAVRLDMAPQAFVRPQAQGRLRKDGRPYAHFHDDKGYEAWKKAAAWHLSNYLQQARLPMICCPFIAKIEHVFARPARPPKDYPLPWEDGRVLRVGLQDLDNLDKAVFDALAWARCIENDRLCVENGGSRKVYAAAGERPCVEVRLWRA